MHRQAHLIPSELMGRKIYLWQYGSFGAPLLVFPSAAGMAHEWETHGMIEALEPLINAGRLKVYCVESNVAEAWTRKENDPAWRIKRHMAYEQFIVRELVPWIRKDCRSPEIRIAVTGCSMGATYSVNFALKFPELFHYALCMSGRYDITEFAGNLQNADVYFNNPLAYAPGLNGEMLERIRRNTHVVLVVGRGKWEDGNTEETNALADVFEAKGISHQREVWGREVNHEWPWWRRQAQMYLGQRFG
jgi:esterase/lipase superfamily enzyme